MGVIPVVGPLECTTLANQRTVNGRRPANRPATFTGMYKHNPLGRPTPEAGLRWCCMCPAPLFFLLYNLRIVRWFGHLALLQMVYTELIQSAQIILSKILLHFRILMIIVGPAAREFFLHFLCLLSFPAPTAMLLHCYPVANFRLSLSAQ